MSYCTRRNHWKRKERKEQTNNIIHDLYIMIGMDFLLVTPGFFRACMLSCWLSVKLHNLRVHIRTHNNILLLQECIDLEEEMGNQKKRNSRPSNIFKMETVYLLLRLKGKRKRANAGHQNAVNVVFLGTKEISALGNRQLHLDFNLYSNLS